MKESLKKELWDNSDTVLGLGLNTSGVSDGLWTDRGDWGVRYSMDDKNPNK